MPKRKSKLIRVYPEDAKYLDELKDRPHILNGIGLSHVRRTIALALAYLVRKERGECPQCGGRLIRGHCTPCEQRGQ